MSPRSLRLLDHLHDVDARLGLHRQHLDVPLRIDREIAGAPAIDIVQRDGRLDVPAFSHGLRIIGPAFRISTRGEAFRVNILRAFPGCDRAAARSRLFRLDENRSPRARRPPAGFPQADFDPIESVIEDIRAGRMVIVVDDEDRENEGDLIMAAEMATPERVNFMTKFGRGLICVPITSGARGAARPAAHGGG